jgi:hypothetical protein
MANPIQRRVRMVEEINRKHTKRYGVNFQTLVEPCFYRAIHEEYQLANFTPPTTPGRRPPNHQIIVSQILFQDSKLWPLLKSPLSIAQGTTLRQGPRGANEPVVDKIFFDSNEFTGQSSLKKNNDNFIYFTGEYISSVGTSSSRSSSSSSSSSSSLPRNICFYGYVNLQRNVVDVGGLKYPNQSLCAYDGILLLNMFCRAVHLMNQEIVRLRAKKKTPFHLELFDASEVFYRVGKSSSSSSLSSSSLSIFKDRILLAPAYILSKGFSWYNSMGFISYVAKLEYIHNYALRRRPLIHFEKIRAFRENFENGVLPALFRELGDNPLPMRINVETTTVAEFFDRVLSPIVKTFPRWTEEDTNAVVAVDEDIFRTYVGILEMFLAPDDLRCPTIRYNQAFDKLFDSDNITTHPGLLKEADSCSLKIMYDEYLALPSNVSASSPRLPSLKTEASYVDFLDEHCHASSLNIGPHLETAFLIWKLVFRYGSLNDPFLSEYYLNINHASTRTKYANDMKQQYFPAVRKNVALLEKLRRRRDDDDDGADADEDTAAILKTQWRLCGQFGHSPHADMSLLNIVKRLDADELGPIPSEIVAFIDAHKTDSNESHFAPIYFMMVPSSSSKSTRSRPGKPTRSSTIKNNNKRPRPKSASSSSSSRSVNKRQRRQK